MRIPLHRKGADEQASQEPQYAAVPLTRGERVLAAASPQDPPGTLVATNHAVVALDRDGALAWKRSWHDVDGATWQRDSGTLTITWVDRSRPMQWRLPEQRPLLQTVRERVQASVVLTQELVLGPGRSGRVVIRQDLSTGDLLEQVQLGRRTPAADPDVSAAVRAAAASLREQVGMPGAESSPGE